MRDGEYTQRISTPLQSNIRPGTEQLKGDAYGDSQQLMTCLLAIWRRASAQYLIRQTLCGIIDTYNTCTKSYLIISITHLAIPPYGCQTIIQQIRCIFSHGTQSNNEIVLVVLFIILRSTKGRIRYQNNSKIGIRNLEKMWERKGKY